MRPRRWSDKIEQVVRLIRSKGVGVFFVTQNPLDVPDKVLGQLGNRVQHALRAFTPRDQKAVRAAAETFRQNPKINTQEAITQLGVGEALVSMLDGKGRLNVPAHNTEVGCWAVSLAAVAAAKVSPKHWPNPLPEPSAVTSVAPWFAACSAVCWAANASGGRTMRSQASRAYLG
jgi:hypothetical protein